MQELEAEVDLPEKRICYEGVFYNYFSIGMHYAVFISVLHKYNQKILFNKEGDL